MYYSANWQLLEEDVWDEWTEQTPGDIDRHFMYVWGIRYIDDSILRREERDGSAGYDITRYYITDSQFSPVVILDDAAEEIERIAYDAYGKPRHYRTAADINGDGHANIDDLYSMMGIDHWGLFGAGDVDRSGVVDIDDIFFLQRTYVWGASLPEGQLSLSTEDNQIGFSGYIYNGETQIYTIRFRHYDAVLGRWLERDPLGYVDGSNLYEYVGGMPLGAFDPMGLASCTPSGGGVEGPGFGTTRGGGGGSGSGGAPGRPSSFSKWLEGGILFSFDADSGVASLTFPNGVGVKWGRRINEQYPPLDRSKFLKNWYDVDGGTQFWLDTDGIGLHEILDGLGLVPGFGELFDLANGLIYAAQGDYFNAGISLLAVAPIVGDTAKASRYVCFVSGTPVHTADGMVPIEEIAPGDLVWSYNAEAEDWELCTVLATSETDYEGDLVTITIRDEDGREDAVTATGEHPFWVENGDRLEDRPTADPAVADLFEPISQGGRWTEARWLRVGDQFVTRSGKSATVVGLEIRLERERVHNLTVASGRTYAVGNSGVLVHNCRGQLHHVISRQIADAIAKSPNLAGHYAYRDPRFVSRAVDAAAHRGYQRWHRRVDRAAARYIERHSELTPKRFEEYLRRLYNTPGLRRRFPEGF